jgi:hypothetical protein
MPCLKKSTSVCSESGLRHRIVNGEIVPWLSNQSDLLEDDWVVFE